MIYPRTTRYISAFLRRYWSQCQAWPDENLNAWVQWFVNNDRCLMVTDRRRILSVTLFRCVHKAEQVMDPYLDTGGPVAYIDLTVARETRGMKACYNLLRDKVGKFVTHICWIRAKHGNRFSIVTLNSAARHLSYG